MPDTNTEKALKLRVSKCRSKLQEIGVKSARHYFSLKYTEYQKINTANASSNWRLDNLWYGKIADEPFTEKLEAFTTYKEVEFN